MKRYDYMIQKGFSVKLSRNESKEIIDWINSQSNLSISIKYLIEKEIYMQGKIIDAATYIPVKRTDEFFENMQKNTVLINSNNKKEETNINNDSFDNEPSNKNTISNNNNDFGDELSDESIELYKNLS